MFCTGCGNKITETERFCKYCGCKNIHFLDGNQSELPSKSVETEAAQTELSKVQTNEVLGNEEIILPAETSQVNMILAEEKDEPQESPDEPQESQEEYPEETPVLQPVSPELQAEIPETWIEDTLVPEEDIAISPAEAEIAVTDAPAALIEEGSLIRAEVTVMPVEQVKEQVKQNKKDKKIGRIIGSVFLSIAAFIITVVLVSAVFSKYILSEKVLLATTQKIDYSNIELGDILTDSSFDVDIKEGDTTLDIVYETLQKEGSVDISKYELEEIFEEATFSQYISDKLAQYSRYALTGDKPEEITPEEIVRLVRENEKVIEKATDLEITSNDLEKMEENLDTNEKELFDSLSVKEMDQTLKDNNLKGIQIIFSNQILIILMIFSFAALIGIIVLISRMHKNVKAPFSYVGIPVLTAGLIITIAMTAVYIFRADIFKLFGNIVNVMEPAILLIITKGIITGAITAGVGLIMVMSYIIIKKAQRKPSKKKMKQ